MKCHIPHVSHFTQFDSASQHVGGPFGQVAARKGAGGSSQPGQLPKALGFGIMLSQQVRANVPAKVLLFGPNALYRLGSAEALKASLKHTAKSVIPGRGTQSTQDGFLPQGSGDISVFVAAVPLMTPSRPEVGLQRVMIAYRLGGHL